MEGPSPKSWIQSSATIPAKNPISITPTYTGSSVFSPRAVLDFISTQGTVKTVSQPQLAVLSGSNASLQIQQAENVGGKSKSNTYWFAPIVADAEAGFGGNLNAFELMKGLIEAGAAAVHFEDQLASAK